MTTDNTIERITVHVEGDQAHACLIAAFGDAPQGIGEVCVRDAVRIGRITPSRYLLLTSSSDTISPLHAAIGNRFVTVTDQSNGLSSIALTGDNATNILSQLCGLDFSPQTFPMDTVKCSSFAKIRATIWHLEDGWHVFFGRSYTDYIHDIVRAAQAAR
jgi:heterotetrameric sarcosine oxidase gamma subunit